MPENAKRERKACRHDGEYVSLRWEGDPLFYAVRGHVDPAQAAKIVNDQEGSSFSPADFRHGWLKVRFSALMGNAGPATLLARSYEKPNFPVTLVIL